MSVQLSPGWALHPACLRRDIRRADILSACNGKIPSSTTNASADHTTTLGVALIPGHRAVKDSLERCRTLPDAEGYRRLMLCLVQPLALLLGLFVELAFANPLGTVALLAVGGIVDEACGDGFGFLLPAELKDEQAAFFNRGKTETGS